jgi:nucleotide-binding universal stress UspA family protein
MKPINRILMSIHPGYIDWDAVDHIAKLAKKTQSAIEVLHVIEDYPQDLHEWWNVVYPLRLYEKIVNSRQESIDGVVNRIKEDGVAHVESKLRWGSELHEVTREVAENNYELVVTAPRPERGAVTRAMGFSCVTELCRQCPSMIWVTKKRPRPSAQRTLAVLGGASGAVLTNSLNSKILRTANWIAQASESDLHVVHVCSLSEIMDAYSRWKTIDLTGYLDELRSEINETCTRFLGESGHALTRERVHLMIGEPGVVIPQLEQERPMDLILMGTHARIGLAQLLRGNTAEQVMEKVDCGVLTVKPDGFVSPLLLADRGYTNPKTAVAA